MWRSKCKSLIFKFSEKPSTSFQNQLLPLKSPTITQSTIPHIPSSLFHDNKFFSINSNPISFYASHTSIFQNSKLHSQPLPSFIPQQDLENENPKFLFLQTGSGNEQTDHFIVEDEVFEEMPQRETKQVETVLSLLQNSLRYESLESKLNKMNLNLDDKFMVSLIETSIAPGENLIRFFKWCSKKSDFLVNSRVLGCLIKAIGTGLKKKDVFSLWDLVKDIGEKKKGVVDVQILNQLIWLFWKLGRGKAGLEVFDKFDEYGCEPNADSYYFAIEALYRCSLFDDAWSVCEKMMLAEKLPDEKKIGHIISCFSKGDNPRYAHMVYMMAKSKYTRPPSSSIKNLIRALCGKKDTVKLAVGVLDDLSGDARKYSIKLFSSVLCGLCRIKETEEAITLVFKMIEKGPPPGNAVFNSIITMLSKAGRMEEVVDLVKVMELRGLRPDVYTYCVIMSGYAKKGQMEEACAVLAEAKKNHLKLSPVAYHVLTRGYCKLEEFDKALEMLNEMKDHGVQPNADEYNKMIQSLCLKAMDWRTAEKLFEEMKVNGLHLNGITQGLIRAVKELEEEHKHESEQVSNQA